MQSYYRMAISQNSNDLFTIRKSVSSNFDYAETRHRYCSENIDSSFKHQKGILTGEKTYVKISSCKPASCNKERRRDNF